MKALMHTGEHRETHISSYSFLAMFPLVACIVLAVLLVLVLAGISR